MKIYLSMQFDEGMSWDNYGTAWEIDHIRPLNAFDLSDPGQFRLCFSWRNLQPLSPEANATKGTSWTPKQEREWLNHLARLGYEGQTFCVFGS